MAADLPKTFVKGFHDEASVRKMEYRALGKTGLMVSKLSFGGGPLGGIYGDVEDPKAIVEVSLKGGVNYIDTAPWYGQGRSEERLGQALKDIPRQAYYIGTKVGRYEKDPGRMFDFSAAKTEASLEASLAKLGLPSVDIVQVHDVEFAQDPKLVLEETLPALQRLVEKGKARFIGITGYPLSTLKELAENSKVRLDTVLSYSRATIFDHAILDYQEFFLSKGVGLINASTTGMGLLVPGGPQDWHPGSAELKAAAKRAMATDLSHLGFKDAREAGALYGLNGFPAMGTTLCGANTVAIARQNLELALRPYDDDLKHRLDAARALLFPRTAAEEAAAGTKRLSQTHWEGVEVQAFRNQQSFYVK